LDGYGGKTAGFDCKTLDEVNHVSHWYRQQHSSILSGRSIISPPFSKYESEFQQLGQDLQSGNLTQAQSDFTTLSQNLRA